MILRYNVTTRRCLIGAFVCGMLAAVLRLWWVFTVDPATPTGGFENGTGPLDDATAIARVTEFLDADTHNGAKVLRLTFHDALDFYGETGGVA